MTETTTTDPKALERAGAEALKGIARELGFNTVADMRASHKTRSEADDAATAKRTEGNAELALEVEKNKALEARLKNADNTFADLYDSELEAADPKFRKVFDTQSEEIGAMLPSDRLNALRRAKGFFDAANGEATETDGESETDPKKKTQPALPGHQRPSQVTTDVKGKGKALMKQIREGTFIEQKEARRDFDELRRKYPGEVWSR